MIKNIKVHKFGTFADTISIDVTVTNERNIVLVVGEYGAGKTTLFDGIRFGLYGDNRLDKKEWVLPELTFKKGAETYVEISFDHDGREYELKRSVQLEHASTINSTLELFQDGIPFMAKNSTKSDREDWLSKIFPKIEDAFSFISDEKISGYFRHERDNTKYMFERILGADSSELYAEKMARIQESASGILQKLRNKSSFLGIEIEPDFDIKAILDDGSRSSIQGFGAGEVIMFTLVAICGLHQFLSKDTPLVVDEPRMVGFNIRHNLFEAHMHMKKQTIIFASDIVYVEGGSENNIWPNPGQILEKIRPSLASEWNIVHDSESRSSRLIKKASYL